MIAHQEVVSCFLRHIEINYWMWAMTNLKCCGPDIPFTASTHGCSTTVYKSTEKLWAH